MAIFRATIIIIIIVRVCIAVRYLQEAGATFRPNRYLKRRWISVALSGAATKYEKKRIIARGGWTGFRSAVEDAYL